MSKFLTSLDLRKTFFKVLVSMLLVFVLLITVSSPSHAAVGVTSILIPAVIATLEAWGIGTAADGLDGADIAEWFHEKLTSWATYAGIALENIALGIKMTPLGQVLLNPIALAGVREFGSWLVQQNGLVAGGSPIEVVSGGTLFNGYQVWSSGVFVGSTYTYKYVCDENCYLIIRASENGSSFPVQIVSTVKNSKCAYQRLRNGSVINSSDLYLSNSYGNGYYYSSSVFDIVESDIPFVSYRYQDILSATGGVSSGDGVLELVPSDDMALPTASDVQDKELLLNTSLDVGVDAAAWYDSVMQKVAANDLTATGTITQAGTITADQVIPQEGITEVDGEIDWPAVTSPIGVSGLDEIFPFCIPFDIYHFFEALAADPVAPSFEIPFRIEGVVDYTFEIDLQPFDQVAQVLRLLELLAFCVGLAFVTRSMFIRG